MKMALGGGVPLKVPITIRNQVWRNDSPTWGVCADSKWIVGMQQHWLFGNTSVTVANSGGDGRVVWDFAGGKCGCFSKGSSFFMDRPQGQQYSHHVFLAVGIKKWIPSLDSYVQYYSVCFFLRRHLESIAPHLSFSIMKNSPDAPFLVGFQGNKLFIGGWLHCHLAHYWVFTDCSLHFARSQAAKGYQLFADVGLMMSLNSFGE